MEAVKEPKGRLAAMGGAVRTDFIGVPYGSGGDACLAMTHARGKFLP
jgi:hypothetical protein